MWPFKKKRKPEYVPAMEATFSETVIVAGKSKEVQAGIREVGEFAGLYTTWVTMGVGSLRGAKYMPGGIHMPRTQAIKAAAVMGQGFVEHLKIQKTHLESTADD